MRRFGTLLSALALITATATSAQTFEDNGGCGYTTQISWSVGTDSTSYAFSDAHTATHFDFEVGGKTRVPNERFGHTAIQQRIAEIGAIADIDTKSGAGILRRTDKVKGCASGTPSTYKVQFLPEKGVQEYDAQRPVRSRELHSATSRQRIEKLLAEIQGQYRAMDPDWTP